MISERNKEEILSATDLSTLIGHDVELRRKGSRLWGCCPFHKERTPSLSVNAELGKWYCFGCHAGGDAITYVMKRDGSTFAEACKELAKSAGVTLEEREQTAEERKTDMEREAMRAANRKAQEYFREQFARSDKARAYAHGRWGEQYCAEEGVGYAPPGWSGLTEWLRAQKVSEDVCLHLGLLKRSETRGSVYDTYRDRITIPIVDTSGNIIGFTARDISGEPNVPKYINSAESLIYDKGGSLFGIDAAKRSGGKLGRVYAVEGAPDAMRLHSIGATNAVACLGCRWTERHFKLIKRITDKICFIPDNDPEKPGETICTGHRAVMESGKLAMCLGFEVTVKELPHSEDGTKNDCDSTIESAEQLAEIKETDFVLWYAAKRKSGDNVADNSAVIKDVAALIANIKDDVRADLYADKLAKVCGSKATWKKSINQATKNAAAAEKEEGKSADNRQLLTYGFYESGGGYANYNEKGEERTWCNFTLKPLFLIADPICAKRLFMMRNGRGEEKLIEFKVEDLVSIQKFRTRIESVGNYVWQGTDTELNRLKGYLYGNTDTAREIAQLGWQREDFFAFGNGAYKEGMWFPADEYGIVRLPNGENYYLPSSSKVYAAERKLYQYERSFVHLNLGTATAAEVFAQLQTVYQANGVVGGCFLLATLFKDVITNTTKAFPILNMFGPKGAGKSELGHTLMSFFVIKDTPPNISNATLPALSDAVSKCSNALVHIDEFKNDIELNKREFLKGIWDGTGRSRMNMDKDKKMEMTSVDSGVMLSGQEMATADIALFSRLIFLRFAKTTYNEEEKAQYAKLQEMQGLGFSHITLSLLNQREHVEKEFPRTYKATAEELAKMCEGEPLEDRILKNWTVPLAAYKIVSKYVQLPWPTDKVAKIFAEGICAQQRNCKVNNEVGRFWECLAVLVQEGEAYKTCEYDIKLCAQLKTDTSTVEFKNATRVLFLRPSRIFTLYLKQMKQLGEPALPRASLKYYLENSEEYLGTKSAVRFTQIVKGVVQMEGTPQRERKQIDRAMCFDYDRLTANQAIDIEIYTDAPTLNIPCQEDDKTPF